MLADGEGAAERVQRLKKLPLFDGVGEGGAVRVKSAILLFATASEEAAPVVVLLDPAEAALLIEADEESGGMALFEDTE